MPKVKAGGGGSEAATKGTVFGDGENVYTVTVEADETVEIIVEK